MPPKTERKLSISRRPSARLLRFCGLLLALVITASAGYSVNTVRLARNDTPRLVAQAWQRYGRLITVQDLEPDRLQLLLAIEDPRFFDHHGVDLSTPGAGMTTISQGLVKLLYFPDGFRQGIAKIRQTLIARYAFDARIAKNEQLELMLNMAYLGNSHGVAIHGFSNAARTYFGKEFGALTEDEFKALVAMLVAPNHFTPGSPAHAERMRRINAYLAGAYRPKCVLDVEYNGKTRGTVTEEALMIVLRLITEAPADNALKREINRGGKGRSDASYSKRLLSIRPVFSPPWICSPWPASKLALIPVFSDRQQA